MKSVKIMGFLNSIVLIILSIIFNQFLLQNLPVVVAKDVLISGDELNFTSTLISSRGIFTLGFFTIPSTSVLNFTYLGIWYTETHQKIWVANRDNPMIGNGVLIIDDSATLKVVNGSGTDFFNIYYNHQVGSDKNTNTRAVLEDSGNFVVYDTTKNQTLWQSFDHSTDALINGMKIGYNLTTKQNWTITSWLSDQFPASGTFTTKIVQYPDSTQLITYRDGEIYWASGPWNSQIFEALYSAEVNISLISDDSGTYFTFQMPALSMIQLTFTGQFVVTNNGVKQHSLSPFFCYGYMNDYGCTPVSTLPSCRGQLSHYLPSDKLFKVMSGDSFGGFSTYNNDDNSSITWDDCMERCWNDCNCHGFTASNRNGTGCITWPGAQPIIRQEEYTNQNYSFVQRKKKTWRWILVSLACVLASVLASYLCYVIIRRRIQGKENRRRDDFIHQLTYSNSFNFGDELEKGIKDAPGVKIFSLKAILAATDDFSNANKLGQGGYGPVYKGKLFDGREIAVKRLSKTSGQGIVEFKSELILISKLQHTNLVRLYGCCIHQKEKMLVYEFMQNKSLDFFLFAKDKTEKIDWQMRFNIIEGIVQGLLYLHEYSRMRVIHRDLKASNVLLDGNMNAKIADFGMAKIFESNVIEGTTHRVVGTYGYMAPEYVTRGTFSIKSDVFSFGVLILEIVSGKKNSSFYDYDGMRNLVGYAWELWKRESTLELKDEAIGDSYDVKQVLKSINVGLLCVQENANDRPTMLEVSSMLNNENSDLPKPKQPAFFIDTQQVENGLVKENIPTSLNGLTLTIMGPR